MITQIGNSIYRLLAALLKSLSAQREPRTYRPEKYYMRGPGPQWRAKHRLPVR